MGSGYRRFGVRRHLYNHTGQQNMYAADGSLVARLHTGGTRIEKTWDLSGTPSDPSDDQFVGATFPNGSGSTGRHDADFCTALVGAIG